MRLRNLLSALTVLALAAAPALSAVRSSGLLSSSLGACVVETSPDGRALHLSNLGSSGQDGVSITLPRSSGHRMVSSSSWSNADVGTVCSWSWGASNSQSVGSGGLSAGRLFVHRLHNGQRLSVDLSSLSSSASMSCALYLDGALVSSFTCPSSSTFDFVSSSSSVFPVPDAGLEFSRLSSSGQRQCLFNLGLKGRFSVTPPGSSQPVECDLIVGNEECDDRNIDVMDGCDLHVTCPAGSSLSSLSFSSQSFVKFGASVSLAGEDCDDDGFSLKVSNNPLYQSGSMGAESPMFDRVFGRSGSTSPLSSLDSSFPGMSLRYDKASPVILKRGQDEGSALSTRVLGSSACSPTGEVASLHSLFTSSGSLDVTADFSGMCPAQESVFVSSQGVLVAAFASPPGHTVSVTAPPGGPLGMAINEKGLPGEKKPCKTCQNPKGPQSISPSHIPSDFSTVDQDGLSLHVSFADPRVVCVDGTCVTGDDVTFHASRAPGGAVITLTGQNFGLQRCSSGSCSPSSSSSSLSNFVLSGVDQIRASIPAWVSLSSSTPVVEVPVFMDRVDATPLRGTSVTLHLSSNLVLAGAMRENTMFSSISNAQTQLLTVDNGGGSYTVDLALLGPGCGPTTSGSLFSLFVSRAPGAADGLGFVSIDQAEAADCTGGPIPTSAAGITQIVLDSSAPTAITDLSATQCKTGNDADGTTCISLIWSPRSNVDETVEIYRASYGNYPLFSRGAAPGSVPSPPSNCPPTGRFSSVSSSLVTRCDAATGACTVADEPSSRDEFYYVAVVRDRAGNYSSCSNMTDGTLSFHLGDVAGGSGGGGGGTVGSSCVGDNQVSSIDISALGAHYGSSLLPSSSFTCLDVGPTSDGSVDGRPAPDGRLSFRDLILYAINYSLVSMPRSAPAPAAAASNTLSLHVPSLPEAGSAFDVSLGMEGAGDALGVSAQLAWDPTVVEPVSVHDGDLLAQQGRAGIVLSGAPGNIDAALFGVGSGFTGRGTLATVTFRVKGAGDPAIRIAQSEARDARNQPVPLSGVGVPGTMPGRTAIRMAFPNPFDRNTTVVLALAQAGPVEVGVYDITGRQVRTLVRGPQAAGERIVSWDGRDDRGVQLGAGVYMLRLQAGGHQETRALRLVK